MSTRRWKGNATDIAQVTRIQVTGTWAAGDTLTITVNGNDATLTVGTTVTIAEVVAAAVAMFNAASKTDAVRSDESRNIGGQQIPEFTEITATDTSPYITFTGNTAGKPFTVSATATTAGDGDVGSASNTVNPTSKYHWDNADNWSGGAVPVNTDDVVFDSGDVPVKFGIDQNTITLNSLTVTQNYEGEIGLPEVNSDNAANPYREYRDVYLKVSATTINIGQGSGRGSGRVKLNVGSVNTTMNVFNSGQTVEEGVESIQFVGTGTGNVANIKKGSVAIARLAGETSTIATLRISYDTNPAGDANVRCGSGTTLTTVYCQGGITEINSAVTTVRMWNESATLTIQGTGAVTTLDIDAGKVRSNTTGTITTATVGSLGILDMTGDPRARTITTLSGHQDATYNDSHGVVTLTNAVTPVQTSADKLNFKYGMNRTVTVSAPA